MEEIQSQRNAGKMLMFLRFMYIFPIFVRNFVWKIGKFAPFLGIHEDFTSVWT